MATTNNAALVRKLAAEAEALACHSSQNKFPVLLRALAKRRKVTAVDFHPLLVDAMLTTHPSGFRILFNSNDANPETLGELYMNEAPGSLLPPRLRFSLAHELAHTLFYDLSQGRPVVSKLLKAGGQRTALENLEFSCNKIAAHLLLPSSLLRAVFKTRESFYPTALISLARTAGVSTEVLVRRLNEISSLFLGCSFYGCVALLSEWEDHIKIDAVARPKDLIIASELLLLRPGEEWQMKAADGTAVIPGSLPEKKIIPLTIQTRQSDLISNYSVISASIGNSASAKKYLMTFEQIANGGGTR